MKKIRALWLVALAATVSNVCAQQTFYDLNTMQKIEITFAQSNWDYILDTAKLGTDGYTMAAKVAVNGTEFDSVGVKYKGNSSFDSTYRKNPFNISLDEFKSQNYQGIKSIKLANCFSDPSMIREVLSYDIARTYMDAPRANYAQVYVNGTLIGLYSNTENINKQFCSDHFYSSNKTFFSCSPMVVPTPQTKSNLRYVGADSSLYFSNYELKSSSGWSDFVTLCDSITNNPASFENVMDADRTIWMLAFNSVLVNLDSYSGVFCQNYYLYKDGTGRFNPIVWDLNMSFGGFPFAGSSNTSMGSLTMQNLQQLPPTLHATDKYWPIINIIMGNSRYKRQYFAHLKTIAEEILASGKYLENANKLRTLIDEAVRNDNNKFYSYNQFQTSLTDNVNVGSYDVPGIQALVTARMIYLNTLSDFTAAAPEITVQQPATVQKGGTIVLTATVQNALQTGVYVGVRFDKTEKFTHISMYDDGAHNDGAANDGVFGCSLTMQSLEANYYVYAENADAGVFSPKRAEHEFYSIKAKLPSPQKGEIVINEFLASNVNGALSEKGTHEDWVELYNTTSGALDLYGVYLSDKFSTPQKFMFPENTIIPAKGFMVVWADEDTSTAQYVHANFKLSASGEQLMLSGSDGSIIDSVTFGAQAADVSWGRCPDGTGSFTGIVQPSFGAVNSCLTNVAEAEVIHDNLMLYPNPTGTTVIVRSATSDGRLTLRNALGEIVYADDFAFEAEISVTHLPAGVYMLTVGNERTLLVIAR